MRNYSISITERKFHNDVVFTNYTLRVAMRCRRNVIGLIARSILDVLDHNLGKVAIHTELNLKVYEL